MANPNRAMAYVPNRAPVEQKQFSTNAEAVEFSATFDRATFEVRVTSFKYGPRMKNGRPNRDRKFNVFVYNKVAR